MVVTAATIKYDFIQPPHRTSKLWLGRKRLKYNGVESKLWPTSTTILRSTHLGEARGRSDESIGRGSQGHGGKGERRKLHGGFSRMEAIDDDTKNLPPDRVVRSGWCSSGVCDVFGSRVEDE
jgi:hypothetical protein